ncbi:MAG: hypothetical protein R6X34_29410 [Chloroflexota bacterium]
MTLIFALIERAAGGSLDLPEKQAERSNRKVEQLVKMGSTLA